MAAHHDSGRPMPDERIARSAVRYMRFATATRQVSIRNTGVNTLWLSFDRKKWHDVACGTSWDDRANVPGFWYCTQTGETSFVVIGLQLHLTAGQDGSIPEPTTEELEGETLSP